MDSSLHKPNLYRWKRHTEGRVYSRSQRLTTNNDVQDWIKKVENASNHAAEEVFGGKGREIGRCRALRTRDQIQDHDHTLTEAQELLSEWMEEKVPLNSELDVSDEAWYHSAIEADVKREWDHLLEDNLDPWPPHKHKAKSQDPYQDIYNMDDKDAVNMVLHNMMEKEVIKDSVLKTLGKGEDIKKTNLHMKMEMRHKQVKENREKRQAEIEQRRRTMQSKKEAQFEAKQILLKEEKEKARKMKQEEMEIQKEMARIRKQMQEEKHRAEEERERRKRESEKVLQLAQDVELEVEQQTSAEHEQRRRGEEQRREFLRKMEHLQARQAAVNIKVLQRHFSAWYSLVLERHMKLGKAKAISDWRCLLKVWNAWKSYTRNKKLEVETQRYQSDVKENYRKQQMAETHHRRTVLRRHLAGWRFWAMEQQDRRELEQAQSHTRSKMMAFLSAAATGQLWQDQGCEAGGDASRPSSAMQKVDEMFSCANRRRPASLSGASSTRSSVVDKPSENKPLNPRIPTEAWQVTRRHLNLNPDEIAQLGAQANDVDTEGGGDKPRKRLGKVPWNIPQMPVNAFENRHKAQQKILEQQQKQLKEQQKLIEELQFNQKNHALQQELLQQQKELQKKLDLIANSQQAPQLKSANGDKDPIQNGKKDSKLLTNGTVHEDTNDLSPQQSARSATTQCSARSGNSTAPSVSSTTSKNSKHLNVLKKMEERAAERARMKEERELKRKQAEEEKMQRLAEEEAEAVRRQEEEKRARVEAYRDKKRQEKQREEEKTRQIERFRELNAKADQHYLRSLLKYRGLLPLRHLVEKAHSQSETADKHATVTLLRKTFTAWNQHVKGVLASKSEIADEMNQYFAVKRCFNNWKNYKNIMSVLEMRARRFHQRSLQHRVFLAWADITAQEKVAGWERERHAREHNLWRMKKKMFLLWREYPKQKRLEAEKEKRKADMRRKVASLLSDFDSTPRNSVEPV